MGKKQVIQTYLPKKGKIAVKFHATEDFFKSRGFKVRFKTFNASDVSDEIDKLGKKGEFVAHFTGGKLKIRLEYGSKKIELETIDVDGEPDGKKRRKMMVELLKAKLIDKSEWKAFDEANPDADVVRELELEWMDADRQIYSLAGRIKALKKFRYDKADGATRSVLHSEVIGKRLGQYFDFVKAVDSARDGRKIFETLVVKSAKKRVILPRTLYADLAEAYEKKEMLDMKPARAYIVRVIDKKIVPKIAPGLIRYHAKTLAKEKKRRDVAAKALKKLGVKASY